ncbi:hypothetical protein JW916_14775, partial [Candidatus Sumerlaeota bacterium]|nr:hypothetical protein [Candidatus Sumerlaeota bacterium]
VQIAGPVDIMGDVGLDKSLLAEGNIVTRKSLARFVNMMSVSNTSVLSSDRTGWVRTESNVWFRCAIPTVHEGDLIEGFGFYVGATGFTPGNEPRVRMWLRTNSHDTPGSQEENAYYVTDAGNKDYHSEQLDVTVDWEDKYEDTFQLDPPQYKFSTNEMELVSVSRNQSFVFFVEMKPGNGTVYVKGVHLRLKSKVY